MDPDPSALGDAEVQLWRVALRGRELDASVEGTLDDVERARIAAIRPATERARYAATHLALRELLGLALGLPAHRVPIERAPCRSCGEDHGKPRLVPGAGIWFNVSRAGDLAVVALTRTGDVGVDVEPASAAAGLAAAADGFATPDEEVDELALLQLWTRKEAVLKADGAGLTVDPLTVTVEQAGGDGWARATIPADGSWFVRDMVVDDDHVAAVASADRPAPILGTWPAIRSGRTLRSR